MSVRRITVHGPAPYDVVVGVMSAAELQNELGAALSGALGHAAQQVAVIAAEEPALAAYVEQVHTALRDLGFAVTRLVVPSGEAGKRAVVVESCWEQLGQAGFTRSDAIVAVGGGATTDLGGFVAASWLRGIPVVHLPTTVLAMVDAAVGGKTGINTGAGKNLVGAFHEPAGVLCNLAVLDTLPPAELIAGLAEVIKCGFFGDIAILELVELQPTETLISPGPVLTELIERAIAVKATVVAGDLKEQGGQGGHPGREVLNYGHTLAHAIERCEDYRIRHGEAVAIGCVYAAELAQRTVGLAPELVERHRAAFAAVELPTTYAGATFDDLLAAMRIDKKSRGDLLRFIVLRELGDPVVFPGPPEAALREAYAAIGGLR